MESPRVFISYSHDSAQHKDRVLALANRLRGQGVDVQLDQYEAAPAEGWPRWTECQITDADFVLVICTATYRQRFNGGGEGLGVKWEGAILTQVLYGQAAHNTRFVPVVFDSADSAHVPLPLQGTTIYALSRAEGYEELYRRLTRQPAVEKPELGTIDEMPSRKVAPMSLAVGTEVGRGPLRPEPPRPPAHFTGRGEQLERLARRLAAGEHVAITALQGMGGIGKTALAQKLAGRIKERFPGGVLWWTLGPRPDVAAGLDAWARSFDPRADLSPYTDLEERAGRVRSMLARLGRLCAIIDDVWQTEAAEWLIEAVPSGCPVLITTRHLDVAKDLRCRTERLDQLPEDDAVELLARLLGPVGRYEDAAREIAQRCDGLPLALEIAAGLIEEPVDLPTLASRLRAKPTLVVLKMPGEERRERSVEACLALSYGDLDADLQRRFRCLGVFAEAPFNEVALAAVWGDTEEDATAAAVASLRRRNLLRREESGEYRQHALLRAYAEALLEERDEIFARLADHLRRFVEEQPWTEIEKVWEHVRRGWEWIKVASAERIIDYIHAVEKFQWSRGRRLEQLEWLAVGLEQARKLNRRDDEATLLTFFGNVYDAQGRKTKALEKYKAALPIQRQVADQAGEARVLSNIGGVFSDLGRKSEALEKYQQALLLYREIGDREGEAINFVKIGQVYSDLGRKNYALRLLDQALVIHRELGSRTREASALNNIGHVYYDLGRKQEALEKHKQALTICQEVGYRRGEASNLASIGRIYRHAARKADALKMHSRALAIYREIRDRRNEAVTLNNIGRVCADLDSKSRAFDYYKKALPLRREVGDRWGESVTLFNIGCVLDDLGRTAEAVSYFEQNVALDEELGHPDLESDRAMLEEIRKKLSDPAGDE